MTIRTLTSLRSQSNPIRVISSLVIAIGMMFSAIMPFVDFEVKADGNGTYSLEHCFTDVFSYTTTTTQKTYHASYGVLSTYSNVEIRTVVIVYPDAVRIGHVSTNYFKLRWVTEESVTMACPFTGTTNQSSEYVNYNGVRYNYVIDGVGTSNLTDFVFSSNIPVFYKDTAFNINDFMNYTFGSGASEYEPLPEINYGNIKDLSYTTRISGLSGDQNHDVISWYPYWDTNDNISAGWDMEIRVVPGTYTSDTQNGLYALDPTNFVINLGVSSYVYQGAYTKGEIEVSWLRVKELLSPWQLSIDGLFSFFDGEYWTKKGWMYQARYIDPDNDYTSEWQNIYTITSSSGKGVEDILDPTDGHGLPDFYQNVQDSYNQVFNTTSNVNNTYNNVYFVNNTPYIVNPDPEQDPITAEELNEIINNALRKLLQMQGDQITIINEGDSSTQQTINNNYNVVQELADQDQQLHDYEYQFNSDLETNLDNIDTSPAVLTNNGFLNAANWVRAQYDRVTLNTPFELVIVFALVLGLGLVIIGKLR